MKELTDFLDKRGVEYTIDGEHVLVPGDVRLICPELTHLPESFGNLQVGDGVRLHCPKLTHLPESFGNLKVGRGLYLDCPKLAHLPESFGNIKAGGRVHLYCPKLTHLPESFGNIKAGGHVYLDCPKLTHLPESFGNIKAGGYVRLYCPNLTNLPTITPMSGNIIEADWCFVDGIVREIISRKTVDGLTILKTPFDYIAGDGEIWAYGKTTKEAIACLGNITGETK